jgi:hypothetical protein
MLLRVDPADTSRLVAEEHISRFRMKRREMDGWLHVLPEAVESDASLRGWVAHGVAFARSSPAFARSLPPK